MDNPKGIRIVISSRNEGEKVLANTLVKKSELISIRFYLQSPEGTDKVLVQTLIEDTFLSFEMQDQLENVLSRGEFTVGDGQLRIKLERPGYKEDPEDKILANL